MKGTPPLAELQEVTWRPWFQCTRRLPLHAVPRIPSVCLLFLLEAILVMEQRTFQKNHTSSVWGRQLAGSSTPESAWRRCSSSWKLALCHTLPSQRSHLGLLPPHHKLLPLARPPILPLVPLHSRLPSPTPQSASGRCSSLCVCLRQTPTAGRSSSKPTGGRAREISRVEVVLVARASSAACPASAAANHSACRLPFRSHLAECHHPRLRQHECHPAPASGAHLPGRGPLEALESPYLL